MPEQTRSVKATAVWVVLLAGAAGLVVALSLLPSSSVAPARVAGATAEAPPEEPTAEGGAPAALTAWDRFQTAQDIVISARDVVETRGLMSLEEGPDNKGTGSAPAESARVSYVWCEDDGRPEQEYDDQAAGPPSDDHLAVFELDVPRPGAYYPWVRVWWDDSCGNSIILMLQREGAERREYVVQGGTLEWWHWLPVTGEAGLELEEGRYRLIVKNREDGARLSRVLFCTKGYGVYKPETPEG